MLCHMVVHCGSAESGSACLLASVRRSHALRGLPLLARLCHSVSLSFSLLIFFLFEKHADDHCNGLLHLHTCSEAYSILPRAKTTQGCRLRKPHDPKIFLHVRTFRFVLYILGCLIRKRQVIVAS